MKRLLVLAWALSACGVLQPVNEAGPAKLSGCFTSAAGVPAAQVPVFLATDEVATHETRTGDDGCFSFDAEAGQWLLVANDFHGEGFIEPVTLYAGEQRAFGTRVTWALPADPRVAGVRGLGLSERVERALLLQGRVTCDVDAAEVRLTTGSGLRVLDAVTGATRSRRAVVELTSAAIDSRSVGLRWVSTGERVQPEGDAWVNVSLVGDAFVGTASTALGPGSNVQVLDTWYGSAAGLTRLGARGCVLFDDGACVRVTTQSAMLGVERWRPTGQPWSRALGFDGEVVTWSATPDGRWLAWWVNGPTGASAWRVSLVDESATVESLGAWAGARFVSLGEGSEPGVLREVVHLALEGAASQWARFDLGTGRVSLVPLPSWGNAQRLMTRSGVPQASLGWVVKEGAGWRVTVVEHLGASVRQRELVLWPRGAPDYVSASSFIDAWFPGFELAPGVAGGVEAWASGGRLFVQPTGAPFESARPVSTSALRVVPACIVGPSLLAFGGGAPLETDVLRFDVAQIFAELNRAP